jgi:hypothetical protein
MIFKSWAPIYIKFGGKNGIPSQRFCDEFQNYDKKEK